MSDPRAQPPGPSSAEQAGVRPWAALNFTGLQFVLFAGVALVALAALLAAGLAIGLALAGAGCLAVLAFAVWFIAANLIGGERPPRA